MKISYDIPKDERINASRPIWREFLLAFVSLSICSFAAVKIYQAGVRGNFTEELMLVTLATNTMIIALVAWFTSRWNVRFNFTNPVTEISNAARKVAAGDFSVRILHQRRDSRYDEMEVLIDDFNKMVEELAANEVLKSDFISNVSHELKTPLAVIKNYADALQTSGLSAEEQARYAQVIAESAGHLSTLVENILRLNKMESQAIVEKERFCLDEQLRCCILALEEQLDEKEMELEVELEDEVFVENDASLLEIAWNNLLGNAIKYTPRGGRIFVSVKPLDEGARVVISDNGCGMSEEVRRHMFDKFYQGDTSHASRGNGLGLAMVARVMELCGARISVVTEEGKGTSFEILL